MRTALVIDDPVMRRLKPEAARQRTTVSALVEGALRVWLETAKKRQKTASPLPAHGAGAAYVDFSDREALYDAMEGPPRPS
jgi:non-ribosomal peptide synthetase component E (peptide arylation enzyme)